MLVCLFDYRCIFWPLHVSSVDENPSSISSFTTTYFHSAFRALPRYSLLQTTDITNWDGDRMRHTTDLYICEHFMIIQQLGRQELCRQSLCLSTIIVSVDNHCACRQSLCLSTIIVSTKTVSTIIVSTIIVSTIIVSTKNVSTKNVSTKIVSTKTVSTKTVLTKILSTKIASTLKQRVTSSRFPP